MSKTTKARKADFEERNSGMPNCPRCGAAGYAEGSECVQCKFNGHGECPKCGHPIKALSQPFCPECKEPLSEAPEVREKRLAKEAIQAEFDAKMKELDG